MTFQKEIGWDLKELWVLKVEVWVNLGNKETLKNTVILNCIVW